MNFTEAAIEELNRIKEANSVLRIAVIGGGCSGLTFKLSWEDPRNVDHTEEVWSYRGLVYTIDSKSNLFLENVTVDYSSGLEGRGFSFDNPSAKRTCGCSKSFY